MATTLSDSTEVSTPSQVATQAASESNRYSHTGDMIKARMPAMVKGAGFVGNGNAPLHDDVQIMTKAHQATLDLRTETYRGYADRASVVKSLNPSFLDQHGYLKTALTTPNLGEQVAQVLAQANPDLARSFTAGNLGIGSISGLVPFDLLAPSRLIYPVSN